MIVCYLWTPVTEDWYVVKPFYANGLFLCTLKTSENQKFCFQGVYKDISGMRWVHIFLNFFEITLIFLNKQQV